MRNLKITAETKSAVHYAIGLLRTDLYYEYYFEVLSGMGGGSAKIAFERVEAEVFEICGVNRFSSYETFRRKRRLYALRVGKRRKTSG